MLSAPGVSEAASSKQAGDHDQEHVRLLECVLKVCRVMGCCWKQEQLCLVMLRYETSPATLIQGQLVFLF